MKFTLVPDYYFDTFDKANAEFLSSIGVKGILLDVDNTLSVAHADKTLRQGVPEWLSLMKENGVPLMILSNAKTKRAKVFADSVGLDVIGLSAKPLPFGYVKAAKRLGVKRKHVAMVGDQIFTDVMGGRLAGVKTVWVTDITPEDKTFFKIKRYFERIMLKRWKNER